MSKASDLAAQVNAALGLGDAVVLGSDPRFVASYLRTGVLPVDVILGGGIPRGRITELYGDYSSLKSYVALRCVAETQAAGGVCAYIDTEHAFDAGWATSLGVQVGDLILKHPSTGEEAVDVTEALLRSKGCDLIVWDSVAATLPKSEHDRGATESVQPARLAEFMSRSLRKLNSANSTTALMFINQTRLNVGITFGSPEAIPGGKALPFYASHRISMKKAGTVKADAGHITVRTSDGFKRQAVKKTVAQNIRMELTKSKLTAPHVETHFTYDLEQAKVDDVGFAVSWALEAGLVESKDRGSWKWQAIGAEGRGRKGLEETIRANPKMATAAVAAVLNSLGSQPPVKRSGVKKKPASSNSEAPARTLARAAGTSKKTGATKPRSTK